MAALWVSWCGNVKRLTHFTESFYWGCNSGFGNPQAFFFSLTEHLWVGFSFFLSFFLCFFFKHVNRGFSSPSEKLGMAGRKITPSHLYPFTRIGAAWPRLVPFLVSLGRKPLASDYKVQILAAGQCAFMLSCFSCVQLFATLWTIACQAPLSMGFSRQEYWSGLLCPAPGDLPDPGIEPGSLMSPAWQVGSLPLEPHGRPMQDNDLYLNHHYTLTF